MLDEALFMQEMDVLARRFGRDLDEDVALRYYDDLAHLTDDSFRAAARVIFRDDTYFPPPARFLDLAGTGTDVRAGDAWERALADASSGAPGLPYSEYEDAAYGAALRSVGGLRRIGQTREDRLPFLRRDFMAAYKAAAERGEHPALGPGASATILPGLGQ